MVDNNGETSLTNSVTSIQLGVVARAVPSGLSIITDCWIDSKGLADLPDPCHFQTIIGPCYLALSVSQGCSTNIGADEVNDGDQGEVC